jgi:hypothetical protein
MMVSGGIRRIFASDLLDAGVDLVTVQKLIGYSDVNTTAGYDRRGEVAKRGAVKKLHVPVRLGAEVTQVIRRDRQLSESGTSTSQAYASSNDSF